jgi:hypothetical protein
MGRTIPSFRMALAMEKEEWKPFRNALSKSEKKHFDDGYKAGCDDCWAKGYDEGLREAAKERKEEEEENSPIITSE